MDKLLQMMGLARRANLLLAGEEVVADAIAAHKARLVLLAADASERTGKKTRQMAGEKLPVLVLPVDKDALGAALGKGSCAVATVLDGGFAAKLAQMLAQGNPDYAAVAEKLDQKEAKRQRRKKEKPEAKGKYPLPLLTAPQTGDVGGREPHVSRVIYGGG